MSEITQNICPTCNQTMPTPKPKRGRPKIIEDYKERKKEYNKKYYNKLRNRLTTITEIENKEE
jgi:hypothetical protein